MSKHFEEVYHCSDPDCDGELLVYFVSESDTGRSYLTDSSVDKIDEGCPNCGAAFKEEK
jgi:hypothetical protein